MHEYGPENITILLKAWTNGDESAREKLIPLVYDKLRELARRSRRKSAMGETLRTTALVHEAYVRLVDIDDVGWNDRNHFFAVAAQLMRRILVDAARSLGAQKRGGCARIVEDLDLDEVLNPDSERAAELVALDDALNSLERLDARRSKIVELRVFSGMSVEETADLLHVSPQTVMRDWKVAKAWLLREISMGV